MLNRLIFLAIFYSFPVIAFAAEKVPEDFVELHQLAPDVRYDIRYASYHNFVGRPIKGYDSASCWLTRPAALALASVENELLKSGLSLKVYDCYRPQQAVDDFVAWSKQSQLQQMKAEFYPRVDKSQTFDLGYIAYYSGHSRGSTVDLTVVSLLDNSGQTYHQRQPLVSCYAPYLQRFHDGGIDMGTGYDCLDKLASYKTRSQKISIVAFQNRSLLRKLMKKYGFKPYDKEWWHFTLKNEPYPDTYFNFPVF